MKTFEEIYDGIGADIQDTSTAMQTIIKRYVNRRYKQVLRAVNFDIVNPTYLISLAVGTADYTLPTDFKSELYCIDSTNGKALTRTEFAHYQRQIPTKTTTQGTVDNYIIYTDGSGNKKIKFIDIPATQINVKLPYIITPSDMSATTDKPVLPIDDIIEVGATADAWRYKRQNAKAAQMDAMFASMYADFIWDMENQPNFPTQFTPTSYNNDNLY